MTLPRFLRRPAAGNKPGPGGAPSLRSVVAWLFIALVALFLTEQHSLFDGPVPLPAALELELQMNLEPVQPG
jgi:hypothetical protein